MSSQQTNTLPHLPKGVAMPEVQVTNNHELIMPGQKALPAADWKNEGGDQRQLVPAADPGANRRLNVSKQGIPWTDRHQSKLEVGSSSEPPPMFTAAPKKMSIRHPRESKSAKQLYRMDNGIDPVTLLTNRLETWRLAIKNMVLLFKQISAVETKTSKGLVMASKDVVVPFKDSNGQFLELGTGGIQDVWASLRDYTMQHGLLHHESAGYIEKAVIPALRALKENIKSMIVSIDKDKGLKNNDIFDSRMQVDRLIGRLDKVIESCNRAPHNAHLNTDPFLVNLGVIHAVRELCDHENRLHDNILNLQKETGIFEQKIIENIRYIINKLQDFRLAHKMEHKDYIGKVVETFDGVKPTLEWNEFVRRNQYNLILENSAYKTENMVEYPNQNSKYVRATKIGPLQIKTGVMKSWTEGVYLLTPAGFLHGYKTPKHFQTNPLRPNYSVFVPQCYLERDEDGSFELTGKDKKSSMGLGMGTHYIFRASNPRDEQEWFDSLNRLTEQFKPVALYETQPTFSHSNVPRNRDLPPLPPRTLPLPEVPREEQEQVVPEENQAEPVRAIEPSPHDISGPSGSHGDDLDPVLEDEESHPVLDDQPVMPQYQPAQQANSHRTNIEEQLDEQYKHQQSGTYQDYDAEEDDGSTTPVASNQQLPNNSSSSDAVATGAAAGALAAGAVDPHQHATRQRDANDNIGNEQQQQQHQQQHSEHRSPSSAAETGTAAGIQAAGAIDPSQYVNQQQGHHQQQQHPEHTSSSSAASTGAAAGAQAAGAIDPTQYVNQEPQQQQQQHHVEYASPSSATSAGAAAGAQAAGAIDPHQYVSQQQNVNEHSDYQQQQQQRAEHTSAPSATATGAAAGALAAGAINTNQNHSNVSSGGGIAATSVNTNQRLDAEKTLGEDQRSMTDDPITPVTVSNDYSYHHAPTQPSAYPGTGYSTATATATATQNYATTTDEEDVNDESSVDNWHSVQGDSETENAFETSSHHSKVADHYDDDDSHSVRLAKQQLRDDVFYDVKHDDGYSPAENQQSQRQGAAAL